MPSRQLLAATLCAATLAAPVPSAQAGHKIKERCINVANLETCIASRWAPVDDPLVSLTSVCALQATLTPSNTLVITFGGVGTASTTGTQVPLVTILTCEIYNTAGNAMTAESVTNGSVSAVDSSTLLATNGPKEWPVVETHVCTKTRALYGPTPVTELTSDRQCDV